MEKKPVYLTMSLPYMEYMGLGAFRPKHIRVAFKFDSEDSANRSLMSNIGLDVKINRCGKFGKNVVVLNQEGDIVKNEHLVSCSEIKNILWAYMSGIKQGKKMVA